MNLSDFDYELPSERIAHIPSLKRGASRLMVLPKENPSILHSSFEDLLSFLHPDDLLVMNNTKVLKSRLFGKKETGGHLEFLFLEPSSMMPSSKFWDCLIKGRNIQEGALLTLKTDKKIRVHQKGDRGFCVIEIIGDWELLELFETEGKMPLPPYIHSSEEESFHQERYQTVFAEHLGAVAAPTAGLHFTEELMQRIKEKNISIAFVTLHVGLGTFLPVEKENLLEHEMHSERFEISSATIQKIKETKAKGGRVISVGTTSLRALEGCFQTHGELRTGWQKTDIFITPGYSFRVIDGLITNFHLPKSTLLMLVSALAGKERMFLAYQEAISQQYRFFSYGDGMFIHPSVWKP